MTVVVRSLLAGSIQPFARGEGSAIVKAPVPGPVRVTRLGLCGDDQADKVHHGGLDKAIHQPHLENFFDAIRDGTPLNCPADSAFASAVTVLKVNEAVAARTMLTFTPADFVV